MKKIIITLLCASMVSATVFAGNDDFEKLRAYADQVTENNKKLTHSNKELTESNDTSVRTIRRLGDDLDTTTKRYLEQKNDRESFGVKCFGAGVAATTGVIALIVVLFKH